jgi:putative transcriptional regulator
VIAMKNRLKVLRAERDWTQETLAQRLGVSRQAINAIETGKYDPSLPLAMKAARLFELRVEDIFFPDETCLMLVRAEGNRRRQDRLRHKMQVPH